MRPGRFGTPWLAGSVVLGLPLAVALRASPVAPPTGSPAVTARAPFAGSGACAACHPDHTRSYERTFHATMTRLPKDLAFDGVDGPLLPVELSDDRRVYRLERAEDGRILYRGPDLHQLGAALEALGAPTVRAFDRLATEVPEVTRPIALTTGSHHYVAFWVGGGPDRELRQLPFVYLLDERKFLRRSAVFLAPVEETLKIPVWNSSCIQCHTTAGAPRETEGSDPRPWVRYHSETVDLSISCEACHGPGRDHGDRFRSPLARLLARFGEETVADVLVPSKLDASASSAVCGQCHAYFVPTHAEEWWDAGFRSRRPAHEDFADGRELLDPNHPERAEALGVSRELSSIFWPDGSVRVGGREYPGLLASPCHERGTGERKLACVDCHQLHDGTREDALPKDAGGGTFCGKCHDARYETREHSRHAPASATCLDCHMPETSYALLGAVRSHTIHVPKASLAPPAGCVLCHLDENEGWLRENLPGGAEPAPREPEILREASFGVRLALAGNAAERALAASWLGREKYRRSLEPSLRRALLAELRRDDYPVLREIARRSSEPGASTDEPLPPTLAAIRAYRDESPIVISE